MKYIRAARRITFGDSRRMALWDRVAAAVGSDDLQPFLSDYALNYAKGPHLGIVRIL